MENKKPLNPEDIGITLANNNVFTPDTRDFDWKEIGFATAPFSWAKGYDVEVALGSRLISQGVKYALPTKNQFQSFSCGGQAWATYDEVQRAMVTGAFVEKSAKFIYAQTHVLGGGSDGRDNCRIAIKQGVSSEALCASYLPSGGTTEAYMTQVSDLTQESKDDAKTFENQAYYNVAQRSIDEIAQAIEANHGIVIGVWGVNNGTWLGEFPIPPRQGNTVWAHWVYAGKAKMINGVKHIGIKNSWGDQVGDHGWQWLSESYFSSGFIYSAWALTIKTYVPADPVTAYKFTRPMASGQNSKDILEMQKLLKKDGVYPQASPCTGYYGNITRNAVLKFQYKYAVASASELNALAGSAVGPKTLVALNKISK